MRPESRANYDDPMANLQIAQDPAADALLACFGTDFNAIAGDQLRLF